MFARFFFRLFLGLFSRRVVRAAYQGILGRPPDAAGLATYARELSTRRDLAWLLADLAQSDECQRALLDRNPGMALKEKLSVADAERLVQATFQALLFREAEVEALAAYSRLLVDTGDIAQFIAEIGNSQEHRDRIAGAARRTRANPRP